MAYELTKAAGERARAAFQRVLDAGVPPYELGQLRLFADEDETHIAREVERKLFVARLANAGDLERKWVTRLKEMAYPDFWRKRVSAAAFAEDEGEKSVNWLGARARRLAAKLEELLPREQYGRDRRPNPGQYYFWHAVTSKTDRQAWRWATELRKAAVEAKEWDVKWFADMLVGSDGQPGGTPEGISDFQMEVFCGLLRWNGNVVRMVRLRNLRGEMSEVMPLEAEWFKSPEVFREWCIKRGNFTWKGNQTQLHELQWDVSGKNAWRIMIEVDAMGWHPIKRKLASGEETTESVRPGLQHGLWAYGDCAYYEGQLLEPDRDGVYHVEGQGYYVARRGRESEFALGKPNLRPKTRLTELLTAKDLEEWQEQPAPKEVKARGKGETVGAKFAEEELLRGFFREVSRRFRETLGSEEAYLAIGAVFAYAAAPEVFAKYGLFPGLWVHGQAESGKTTITEWLMHLVGFRCQQGSSLRSTAVGLMQESQNYSNLPLLVDEFKQEEIDKVKLSILKDAFNRLSLLKWSPDGVQRKTRTAYIVSGESTTTDAATRGRYPHVQVSAARRLADHLYWFGENKARVFVFWRAVMERREEFVGKFFTYLGSWMKHPATVGVAQREKVVHGIAWSAWRAVNDLLGTIGADGFDDFLVAHMRRAASDVHEVTNINVFFTDLISAFNAGDVPPELFRVESSYGKDEHGFHWEKKRLFFEPEGVISAVAGYLRQRGAAVTLRRSDLRDQLSKNDFWIPGQLRKRFTAGGVGGVMAWGIEMDLHPLGKQEVTAEGLKAALDERQGRLGNTELEPVWKDGDPRKGPLFAIVERVERRERERRQEQRQEGEA